MALDFPALLATFPPGAWPAKDDDGERLLVTTNPLRNIARPRNKSLITRIASPGAPAVILSGAVSAIVEHVVLGTDDPVAVKSFLLGYLPYLSPVELVKMSTELIDSRLKHERGRMPAAPKRRLLTFFCEWLDTYGSRDFKKKGLATEVLNCCSNYVSPQEANKLKLRYIKVVRSNSVVVDPSKIAALLTPNTTSGRDFNLEDLTPAVVADYLTHIEINMYRAMQPWEFLKQAWQQEDKQSRAPHLSSLIARFNQVSNWVASQVVQAPTGHGARVITHFIEIAKRLFDMNNYNTLMEILSGLNNANVSRLRPLWSEIPGKEKELFERLDEAMAPQANFRNYRELVKSKRSLGEFVFPYLAVHLRDLTFVNEANPDYTPNKFLNFEKLVLQGTTILDLMALKNPAPNLACEDAALLQWLRQMKALSEEEIRNASLCMVPLKNAIDVDTSVPLNLSSSAHQQWGPSALIHTVEVKQLASWTPEDIEAWLAKNSSKAAADCLMKQVRSGPQLLHLTEDNLVSLGVPKESLSPLLAALKQLREHNPDMRVELSSLLLREPKLWSVLDVAQWLVAIGLGALRQIFIFHLVDGPSLFQLTDSLLVDMQIRDPVHRSRLLHKIGLLQERSPSALNDDDSSSEGEDLTASTASISSSTPSVASNTSDSSEAEKSTFVCYYEDTKVELRLVRTAYKKFKRTVRKNFGSAHMRIKYQDQEGQLSAIKSDADLTQALQTAKDGQINLYLFAKRRKRLTFTGARAESPVAFLRSGTSSVRMRSRSGSSVGIPHFRDRAPSSSSLTGTSASDHTTPHSASEQAPPDAGTEGGNRL